MPAGEHLALAGGFEVAVDLLVDGHAAEGSVVGLILGRLRGHLYFKRPGGMSGHDGAFLGWSGILRVGPRERSGDKTERQAQARDDRSGDSLVFHFCSVTITLSLHGLPSHGDK